jgi:hypothetical protein
MANIDFAAGSGVCRVFSFDRRQEKLLAKYPACYASGY